MKSNFHLLFYIRKQKNYKGGAMPIYMRITVSGKRADMSAGRECEPVKWNSHAGRAIGTKEEIKSLNNYLDSLQSKVRDAHQALIDANQTITTESLLNQFTGKTQKSRYLMQLFTEHNAKVKALIGNGFEANTLKGYNTSEKHLTGYLQNEYSKTDIEISQLNHAFITGFEFYLKAECKISGVSAAKYIKHLKKIVNHCIANNWLKQNPFINFKSSAKAKERTYLTQQELDAITNKKFVVERLVQVRDVFVFCCYTGLSYADVKKLRRNEIGIGMDGDKWIFTSRQKTDTSSRIPLLPVALTILNRYQDHPQCENKGLLLPVLSNQKMNAYLKEIADLSDVVKHLTFHLARHTFATTVTLSNNVPIETVSKMLGHTNIKTTQHYAKILDLKVSHDMAALKQKYAGI
ncbi:site-specific integrase [Mucilaginibacter rubeus]|uniref:Site-specific integrase n=2 Tax=Mucilaginibacter rubeus TaxID=2027860 RepID=A0AAE6JJM6_9SPHI|nr:site-specific integrase [Mucilaginibacter rubeus]QEM19242.1 site-specific integrase [Mucilaginibacter gossypii]QEM06653.1 site-specific integrase [Mucilaginibacter rubeus]QTE44214.1 site-specific integrase [Mucilaginibacter rubeus]QTE50814.1 site-specific integrase [Mucilaginibacter rubeus]QTE55896.1 site-specific integrase [Mucilaginibacter rubeus]